MLRGTPHHRSPVSSPAAPPITGPITGQGSKAPRRALWALSPLILLALLAGGARLYHVTSGGQDNLPSQAELQTPITTQHVDKTTQKELEATITGQLNALRHKDWDKAFSFTDVSLRQQFDTAGFRTLIETSGFAIMPKSNRQEYRKGQHSRGLTTMLVTIRTADGDGAGFVYRMVRESDGWHIAACGHALDPTIASLPPLTRDVTN